jgi:hypothetical protein
MMSDISDDEESRTQLLVVEDNLNEIMGVTDASLPAPVRDRGRDHGHVPRHEPPPSLLIQ